MKLTMSMTSLLCALTLGVAGFATAAGRPGPAASTGYKWQYTVRLSGLIGADALGPSLRALIGNRAEVAFTLVGQCPTSNGSPNGWGMINLGDVGKAVPIYFNVSAAPPGSLPGLGANGFPIAKRLEAQQIVIDQQMTYFNLPNPALIVLAPADPSGANWIGDVVNGSEAGFTAKVTEVTFDQATSPGW